MKYVLIIGLIILVIVVIGVIVAGWVYLNVAGVVNGPKQTSDMSPYSLDKTLGYTPELLSEYQFVTSTSSQALSIIDLNRKYGTYSDMRYISETNTAEVTFYDNGVRTKVILDSEGEAIGILKSEHRTFPVANYYIAPKGFYQLEDGVFSSFTSYEDMSDSINTAEELETLHESSLYYRGYSLSDYGSGDREYEEKLSTHVFFHEGVWKKASVSPKIKNAATMRSDTAPNTLEWKIPENAIESFDTLYQAAKESYNPLPPLENGFDIQLDYFEKEMYTPAGRASIGSTTGYARPASWSGIGYYTISQGDNKIKFKIEDDIMHELSPSNDKQLHSKADLGFALLTIRGPQVQGQAEETIYLIKN